MLRQPPRAVKTVVYDALIIGGGASGLIAACDLVRRGLRVALLEKQDRVGRKLLARIETCLDEGKEIDLKEIKAVTGALKELQALDGEPGESGGERTLTVRFVGETEEMSR